MKTKEETAAARGRRMFGVYIAPPLQASEDYSYPTTNLGLWAGSAPI